MMRLVWALTGRRVGDNSQVVRFAAALDADVREIPVTTNVLRHVPNLVLGATRATVAEAPGLEPPWPDAVIGAGQRTVPVARWIRMQSGGRTKLIFLGRPRAPLGWFDLLVTTPQYGLPVAENVAMVELPIVAGPRPQDDGGDWQRQWAAMARPLVAVFVGGSSWPYELDEASLERLAAAAEREADGGTIVYVTSPRTSERQAAQLGGLVRSRDELWRWTPEARNPHPSLLVHADRFVVTEDSISMIADGLSTGKPVRVVDVKRAWQPGWRTDTGPAAWLARTGLLSPPRDVRHLVELLARRGRIEMEGVETGPVEQQFASWPEVIARAKRMIGT